jgi:hypothetical protein
MASIVSPLQPIANPTPPKVIVLHYMPGPNNTAVLAPIGGIRTKVAPGRAVVFVPGDAGAANLTVTFPDISPFGEPPMFRTINGGSNNRVVREVNAADANANVYKYDCRVFIDGLLIEANGGGEIEIDPEG